jgi:hypothetical protein
MEKQRKKLLVGTREMLDGLTRDDVIIIIIINYFNFGRIIKLYDCVHYNNYVHYLRGICCTTNPIKYRRFYTVHPNSMFGNV